MIFYMVELVFIYFYIFVFPKYDNIINTRLGPNMTTTGPNMTPNVGRCS